MNLTIYIVALVIIILSHSLTLLHRLQSYRDNRRGKRNRNRIVRWYQSIKPEGHKILFGGISVISLEVLLLTILSFFNTSNSKHIKHVSVSYIANNSNKPRKGVFTDFRDGNIYHWVSLEDGNKWMTENVNFKTSQSWCYGKIENNCIEYGRLYRAESSLNACPENWRLPTESEWKRLAIIYGGIYEQEMIKLDTALSSGKKFLTDKDIDGTPSKSYKSLVKGGNSNLSISLSGHLTYKGEFVGLGNRGYYWSDTKNEPTRGGYAYYFYNNRLGRSRFASELGMACRCIKIKD